MPNLEHQILLLKPLILNGEAYSETEQENWNENVS